MIAREAGYTRPPDPPEPRDTCGTCCHWEQVPGNPWGHMGVCLLWTSQRESVYQGLEWCLDSEYCDDYEE